MGTRLPLLITLAVAAGCSHGGGGPDWISHVPGPVVSLSVSTGRIDAVEGSSENLVVSTTVTNPSDPPPLVTLNFNGLPSGVSALPITVVAGSSGTLEVHANLAAPQTDWKNVTLAGGVGSTPISGNYSLSIPLQIRVRGTPGSLDKTFGTGGHTFFGWMFSEAGYEPDGTTVIAGTVMCTPYTQCMGAYVSHPNGTNVTSTWVPPQAYESVGGGLLVEPDGGFFVAGSTVSPSNLLLLAHWRGTGNIDPFFGTGGGAVTTLPGTVVAKGVALDRSGILELGVLSTSQVVVHLTDSGQPDAWGSGGSFAFTWEGSGGGTATGLAVDSAGRAVVSGNRASGSAAVARIDPTGQLDPSFAGSGIFLGSSGSADGIAILPDGRIITCGSNVVGGRRHVYLLALTTAGVPAMTFGNGGVVAISSALSDLTCGAVSVDAEGRLVLAGTIVPAEPGGDTFVARYLPDGSFDPTFDTSAGYRAFFQASLPPTSITFDSEGRIVIVGEAPIQSVITRLWP